MKPLLEIPVCLAGKPGDDSQPEKEVMGRVLPDEIAFHYPGYHWGSIIVLKSGHSFLTTLDSEAIDTARLAYDDMVTKNPALRKNVQIKQKEQSKIVQI